MIARELLNALLLAPLLGVVALLFARRERTVRQIALGASVATLLIAVSLIFFFDRHSTATSSVTQFITHVRSPLAPVHFHYSMGIDGVSLPLIVLTAFVAAIAIAAARSEPITRRRFFALTMIFETAALGVFLSLDFVSFWIFFELAIALAGLLFRPGSARGTRRGRASLALLLYMIPEAVLLLIPLIAIVRRTGTADLTLLQPALSALRAAGQVSPAWCTAMFVLLMAGFLIHAAVAPLHAWFIDAHSESSSAVRMLLTALVQNAGMYGIVRIAYGLFPATAAALWLPFAALALANVLYAAFCVMGQSDVRRLIAHASIASTSLVLLGIAIMDRAALSGAMLLMIASGLALPMLIYAAGLIEQRTGSRDLARSGGLAAASPQLSLFTLFAVFAVAGVPLTGTFVADFLIVTGAFRATRASAILVAAGHAHAHTIVAIAIIASAGIALNSVALLSAFHRAIFGRSPATQPNMLTTNGAAPAGKDLAGGDIARLSLIAALIVLLGVLPSIFYFSLAGSTIDAMSAANRRAIAPTVPPRGSSQHPTR